ncbi:MAG TPA: hypothetical protein VMJ35_05000 [Dongiaceae bacterium]|nr:hypothetical protein [Dongiaceae bacterium]
MINLKLTIALVLLCALVCGATFLFALYRQFALVEVASSLVTMIEVYLLSSSIGELIEGKREIQVFRAVAPVVLAASVVACFLFAGFRNH